MMEKTLQSMKMGGIYDHIGFGFHRYSTDAQWLRPHFEKMLSDQAYVPWTFVRGSLRIDFSGKRIVCFPEKFH